MRHQVLSVELPTERLGILRLGETEHHEVEIVPSHRESPRRHRGGFRKAMHDIVVSMAPHFVHGDGDMVESGELALASHGTSLSQQNHGALEEASPFIGGREIPMRVVGHSIAARAAPEQALGDGPPQHHRPVESS
jgi:hypothetical protein